jgi:hypothetical protein
MAWEHGGTDFQSRFDKSTAQAEQMKEGGATGSVMDNPLMVADILIWQSTNALVLIPVVIGLVMLVRWMRGRPVFTERDWLFLFGHRREKVLSLHLWLRFAAVVRRCDHRLC